VRGDQPREEAHAPPALVEHLRDDRFRSLRAGNELEPFAGLVDDAVARGVHQLPVTVAEG